mmetsp:Transcript_33541/g.85820  ORF Transcript_33541/g.85820 Transcript_33541/m.85820 type:complete len:539 (-) Transcript_33541:82-1698(-)
MGATLPTPVESTVVERHGAGGMRVGVSEMNGWRNNMEDAHLILIRDDWAFFGVFDGHGGDQCSAFVARRLREELEAEGCPADDAAVKKLMLKIDREFLDSNTPSGSTGTMCIVKKHGGKDGKHLLRVINVGDSRVILGRGDGNIVDGGGTDQGLTTDHKPDHPSERERIYRCGGTVEKNEGNVARVNGDLAVSRGFGDSEYKKTGGPGPEDHPVTADPELGEFECDPSDFVLLVCDGVSEGNFPNPEVIRFTAQHLREHKDPGAAARAVCHQAVAKDSKDNITCMCVTFDDLAKEFKEVEFTPGPLNSLGNKNFKTAYMAIAERAGYSLAQAVELRYEIVQKKLAVCHSQDPADEEQLREEAAKLGEPAGAPGSPERARWFEKWVGDLSEDGGGDGPGGMDLSSLLSGLGPGRAGGRGSPGRVGGRGAGAGKGYAGGGGASATRDGEERAGAGYTWSQKGDEVQVTFKLGSAVTKKDVKVAMKPTSLSVAVHGEQLLDGMLKGRVDTDESTWCLDADGCELQVMLTKASEESWSDLLK